MQPDALVLAQVVDVIRTSARLAPTILVTPDSRMAEDLGVDSLGLVRLALELERRFGVFVEAEQLIGFHVVSDVVEYISLARTAA